MPSLKSLTAYRRRPDGPEGEPEQAPDAVPDEEAEPTQAVAEAESEPGESAADAVDDESVAEAEPDPDGEPVAESEQAEQAEPDAESEPASESEPDAEGEAAAESEDADESPERRAKRRVRIALPPARKVVPVALCVSIVALSGAAVWFRAEANSAKGQSASNTALTDSGRTSEVLGEVDQAVNTLFTYDYSDTAKTDKEAASVLSGKAISQYATLMSGVHAQAASLQLVLTTTVTYSGVRTLHGDHAHLVVFVDQRSVSTKSKQASYSGAMLTVDAVQRGGFWHIEGLTTFS